MVPEIILLYRQRIALRRAAPAECDFVVQRNERVDELIQVTWDMSDDNTREREINGLLEASKATGCDKLTIITIDEESAFEINGKTIHVMPAWKWALGGY